MSKVTLFNKAFYYRSRKFLEREREKKKKKKKREGGRERRREIDR